MVQLADVDADSQFNSDALECDGIVMTPIVAFDAQVYRG